MPLMIGGQVAPGPKKKELYLPRDTGVIVFHFLAVNDDSDFQALVKRPGVPRVWKVGEGNVDNPADPNYIKKRDDYAEKKGNWYFLTSIAPSNITWETIDMANPETWGNWQNELKAAGFSESERDRIYSSFLECNMVTDSMLIEARNRFFSEQQAKEMLANVTSLLTEQDSTSSGEPVNASESSLPK